MSAPPQFQATVELLLPSHGVPWIKAPRRDWAVTRLTDAAKAINGFPFESSKFTRDTGIPLVRIRDITSLKTEAYYDGPEVPEATIEDGDILVGMDGDFLAAWWQGGRALLNQRVCAVRARQTYSQRFLFYVLCAPLKLINDLTYYTTVKHLSSGDLLKLKFCAPSYSEQRAIAAFLDRETARLDGLVAQKEKLLALLEEKRASLITHTVTRGLNPHAPTKPSGIPWLGNVPMHWEVLPLRRRWQVYDCKHVTAPFVDEGIPLASTTEVQGLDLDLSRASRTTPEFYERLIGGGREPRHGDIIYCRNVTVGAAAFVNTDEHFAMGQDVCLIRSETENQRFLAYQMRSGAMRTQLGTILIGSTFQRINVAEIKTLIVTIPPRAEQDAICQFLDPQMQQLSAIETKLKTAIGLLRERRTALISAAVTGQIDVRNYPQEAQ